MRPKSGTLTAQELEIMKVIWPLGRATVRDVYDTLKSRRSVAYTTVQTMMNILEGKGHLSKVAGDKAHVYAPVRPQQQVVRSMVREFVNRVFDGSARPLLVHLLKEKGLTERERRELQRLLSRSDPFATHAAAYSAQLAVRCDCLNCHRSAPPTRAARVAALLAADNGGGAASPVSAISGERSPATHLDHLRARLARRGAGAD
jgi:predicted transcriptional regulator